MQREWFSTILTRTRVSQRTGQYWMAVSVRQHYWMHVSPSKVSRHAALLSARGIDIVTNAKVTKQQQWPFLSTHNDTAHLDKDVSRFQG